MEEVLTVPEFARLFRLKPRTIYEKIQRGEIPKVPLGRSIRISRRYVDELLKAKPPAKVRARQKALDTRPRCTA